MSDCDGVQSFNDFVFFGMTVDHRLGFISLENKSSISIFANFGIERVSESQSSQLIAIIDIVSKDIFKMRVTYIYIAE